MSGEDAKLTVWMEMRSEIAMREAAMVALYAGATEEQFVDLARETFRSHKQKRDQRVADKESRRYPSRRDPK